MSAISGWTPVTAGARGRKKANNAKVSLCQ